MTTMIDRLGEIRLFWEYGGLKDDRSDERDTGSQKGCVGGRCNGVS